MIDLEKVQKKLVKKNPVAKFYYKNDHSHPVRRTVLVTKETKTDLWGYELREGREVRGLSQAPMKKYSKSQIPNFGDYCRFKMSVKNYQRLDTESTLERFGRKMLAVEGV